MDGLKNPQMPKGCDLAIRFRVIANGWQGLEKFKAEISLTNGSETFLSGNWTIYFNFLRKINPDTVSGKAAINHINGDLFSLSPSAEYMPLGPGEEMVITFVADFWAIKISDAPSGFYVVFRDINNAELPPEAIANVYIEPFETPEQTTRCKEDVVPVPTPFSRFLEGEKIMGTDTKSWIPVLPTPVSMEKRAGSLLLSGSVTVYCQEDFTLESLKLQADMGRLFGINAVITDSIEEARIVLLQTHLDHNEAYSIEISSETITISALTSVGVFYGIQTLLQIIACHPSDSGAIRLPALKLRDKPLFLYRGLHLDVARNFQKPATVRKLIGLLAHYKLNRFHFHLTDDEGWRLEIPGLPELTEIGSRRGHTLKEDICLVPSYGSGCDPCDPDSPGNGYYSRQEFIEILQLAHSLHVEVIPAIDIPGHARAAIVSMNARYHRFMDQGDRAAAEEYLLTDPADISVYESVQMWRDNVVTIVLPSVYRFIEKVVREIVSMYRDANVPLKTLHIGGDEVPSGVWQGSPAVTEFLKSNPQLSGIESLSGYFLKQVTDILGFHGLQTAGWEEVAMHNGTINGLPGIVAYCWNTAWGSGGEKTPYLLANAGHSVVMCNAPSLYFDFAFDKSPKEEGFYWGGFTGTRDVFGFNPFDVYGSAGINSMGRIPDASTEYAEAPKLDKSTIHRILGIQGQLWGETLISPQRLEYMLLPRLLALSERAWGRAPWSDTDSAKKEEILNHEYSIFAHKAGLFHLAWIDRKFGFTQYRIPPCGIKIQDSMVYINNTLPGMQFRYTTDGSEPDMDSLLYTGPVPYDFKILRVKAFSPDGSHCSRVSELR